MGPIFEQAPLRLLSPRGAIDKADVVGAEPGESRKIMGPSDDVDAVDLVKRQSVDQPPQMPARDLIRPGLAEPLSRQGNPPSGCE